MSGGETSCTAPASGLPFRLTPVIGREATIETIGEAVERHRVVTIVGPGGIGKSTVALATAERALACHIAVRFVDLALCRDPAGVLPFVAGALDLPAGCAGDLERLAAALAEASILIVLDNCEQVVDAVAQLVSLVAVAAPRVHFLATSREPLLISGERVHRLPSLDLPPADQMVGADEAREYSAIALFAERAAAVKSQFELGQENVGHAIEICRRLDGIPLAIELAAARVDTLSLVELATRLDDRFSLLTSGRRTALPRHQTLGATLDWSYETLSADERTAAMHFSVFVGAFSLASALAVAHSEAFAPEAITHAIAGLAAKSLLVVQQAEDGVSYRMLETTLHYCRMKLHGSLHLLEAQRRHARTCLDLLAGAREDLQRLRRAQWMRRYGALVGDIQVALDWAFSTDGDAALGTALTAGAAPLGEQLLLPRGYFHRLEEVVDQGTANPEIVKLGHPLAHARIQLDGDLRLGRETVRRMAASRSGTRPPEMMAAEFGAALLFGQYPLALEVAREIEACGVEAGDLALEVLGHRCAAQAQYCLGQFNEASRLAQIVLDCPFEYLPHSMNSHRISMRITLGSCAAIRGNFPEALRYADEVVRLGRDDNPLTNCLALAFGGIPVAIWAGDEWRAREWLAEGRRTAERAGAVYWQLSIEQLRRGADAAWHRPVDPGPPDAELEDKIGATARDMLPTFSPTLLGTRHLERVEDGTVAWNAAEVLRAHALRIAADRPAEAIRRLDEAAEIARRQGAGLWQRRIDKSRAELASMAEHPLSFAARASRA